MPRKKQTVSADETIELKRRVGDNIERIRKARGLSLERLANLSGVSRAMLGQIESGESAPTISLLWKVSRGLNVRFADLLGDETASDIVVLPAATSKVLRSLYGEFESRALFPFDMKRQAEFYELRMKPGHIEPADPHPPGTYENLVVHTGRMNLTVADSPPIELRAGDSVFFRADLPHVYANPGKVESIMYLVMTYAQPRD